MPISVTGSDSLEFAFRIDTSEVGKDTNKALVELEKFRNRVQQMTKDLKLNPRIDTKPLEAEILQIETKLSNLTVEGLNTGPVYKSLNDLKSKLANIKATVIVSANTDKATQTIETLRAKLLTRQELILQETDISKIAAYNKEIQHLQGAITKMSSAGKTGFDDLGNKIKEDTGLISELQTKLKGLELKLSVAKSTNEVSTLNKEIEKTKIELQRVSNIGRTGFDEMGNKLKQQEGILQRLQRQASIYKQGIEQATLPQNISKYNAKLEATNIEIAKLSNIGKTGFDEFGNAIPKKLEKTGGALNAVSKGFGFFRQAAYLIPGIGLAGIFNLIGEGVAALVTQLFKGGDAVKIFARNFENLKEVMAEANKDAGKQIADLKILYSAATNVNLSMNDRLAAVKALKTEFPDYFGNIDSEIILNGKAKTSYDELYTSILKTSRAKAAKDKIDQIEAQRLDVAFNKQKIINATAAENARINRKVTQIVDEKGNVLGGVGGVISIQQQEAAIAKRRSDALAKEALKDQKLNEEEKFLIAFAGEKEITKVVEGENKKRNAINKAARGGDKEYNDLLNERLRILELIAGLQHDAFRSGLLKEESELDRINERYDSAIKNIDIFNKKQEEANKKRGLDPNTGKITADQISQVNNLRAIELTNSRLKTEAENYKNFLADQQRLFEQYENAKRDLGVEKANQMFDAERKGFTSYQEFLQAEVKKNLPKIQLAFAGGGSLLNIGDQKKILELFKQIDSEAERQKQVNVQNFKELLSQTADFSDKRQQIEDKYQKFFKTLSDNRVKLGEDEYERRLRALQTSQDDEINVLINSFARQSVLYKKLGEDLILSTRSQLKQRLAELQKISSQGFTIDPKTGVKTFLTPQMQADLQAGISATQSLLDNTNKTAIAAGIWAKKTREVASVMNNLADLASVFDDNLAEGLATMGQMVDAMGDIATSVGQFATGDIVGGIGSAISGVGKLLKSAFGESAEEKAFKERLKRIEFESFNGEFAINELYRERLRDQIRINELKLKGIKDETDLLNKQKGDIQTDFEAVLRKIQTLSFTGTQAQVDEFLKQNPGISASQKMLIEISHLVPLVGKSFADLEKLNTFGQLDGDAKALFETLQKLKNEGADVDKALADLKKELQETLTGTTSDSITDSIVEGFKNGLHSASDFAGTFEDLMRGAIINSLKFKYLEGPLKDFFEQFAAASESDNTLTKNEIDNLQKMFNSIITNADKRFEQLQSIAGLNFASSSNAQSQNTLVGNVKQLTEDTANVLAGQFAGMRVAQLQLVDIQKTALGHLNTIESNTATTFMEIRAMHASMISYFRDYGVKMK